MYEPKFISDRLPDDKVIRELFAVEGLELHPEDSRERRWRVRFKARSQGASDISISISARYLPHLTLSSRYIGKKLFQLNNSSLTAQNFNVRNRVSHSDNYGGPDEDDRVYRCSPVAVSYTHLTLPTICSV